MSIKICQYILYRLKRSYIGCCSGNGAFIRFPLAHMQVGFSKFKSTLKLNTHIVKTLKSAHTRCAYSYSLGIMLDKFLKSLTMNTYIFGMHLMSLNLVCLNWLEGSSTNMQCKFLSIYTRSINGSEYFWGEMKACCRCCNRAFNLRVNRLICGFVAFLSLTIKIWRDRKFANRIEQFCQ